ncbi:MAG: filamentous hemagglutinin N-terminal domain-containing protein, partial [Microcystaceae cyanobacterium]
KKMTQNLAFSLTAFFVLPLSLTVCSPAIAQIVPDGTLGSESSTVKQDNINGFPSDVIEGGAARGANLFHSFSEFNVGEGRGAYFANPAAIENILSRVTGGNLSNILGTLGVLGNANLFFINPNGIVFGPNARLDLRGSFVASTADSLLFENGFEFSASNPQAPPLLTVDRWQSFVTVLASGKRLVRG